MGKLYFITGDIIENSKGMDAIVNAQNKYMINGSGICGAIYRNAGIELQEYCKENYKTTMEPCEVRLTPGFNLNMDIIHSYAPIFWDWENPIDKLIEAYSNVIEVIKSNNYKKVIIPSLGTGVHGYKHEEVASKVINLLYKFCVNNDVDIYFVNLYSVVTDIYFNELLKEVNLSKSEQLDILKNEHECFENFVDGKEVADLCNYEKLIYLKVTGEEL